MNCNCKPPQPAILRTSQKPGPNFNRQFYCCAKRMDDPTNCRFFKWAKPNQNLRAAPNVMYAVQPPFCFKHGRECVQRRVNKDGPNKGRYFYSCIEKNCMFVWSEDWTLQKQKDQKEKMEKLNINTLNSSMHEIQLQVCGTPTKQMLHVRLPNDPILLKKAEEILMQIPGCESDPQQVGDFKFPWFCKSDVIENLKKLENVKINPIPDTVIDLLKQYPPIDCKDDSKIDWNKIPKKLRDKLMPFQKQGVVFGVMRNGKVLIGDEMGLGKTVQAISMAWYFKADWPLLIICPSSLKLNWSLELEKWLTPQIHPTDINIVINGKADVDSLVNIVSYDLAVRMKDKILARNFQSIIVDECHYLKNTGTQRSMLLTPVIRRAKRTILITGTPALSRPIELFNQLSILIGDKFFSRISFAYRYCNATETAYGLNDKGASNLNELNYWLTRTVMIRRLKDDVMNDLPDKIRQQIYLPVKTKDLNELKKGIKKMQEEAKHARDAVNPMEHKIKLDKKHADWLAMFKATGLAKLPAIKEYLKDILEGDTKFIIFAHHLDVLNGIEEIVKKQKVDYIRIDGSTLPVSREKLAEKFRTVPSCRVAILSIQAAGVGLTLTPCSNVIFAELFWTPGQLVQAEDRVHRIGQKTKVTIKYLLAKETLDDILWPMIVKKLDVVHETLDGKEDERKEWEGDQLDWTETQNNNVDDLDDFIVEDELDGEEEWLPDNEKEKTKSLDEPVEIISKTQQNPPTSSKTKSTIMQQDHNSIKKEKNINQYNISENAVQEKDNKKKDHYELYAFKRRGRKIPYNLLHKTKDYKYRKSMVDGTVDMSNEELKESLEKAESINEDDFKTEKKRTKKPAKTSSTTKKSKRMKIDTSTPSKSPTRTSFEPKTPKESKTSKSRFISRVDRQVLNKTPVTVKEDIFSKFEYKPSPEKRTVTTNVSRSNLNSLANRRNTVTKKSTMNVTSFIKSPEKRVGTFPSLSQELEESRRVISDVPTITSDIFRKKKRKTFLSDSTECSEKNVSEDTIEPPQKKLKHNSDTEKSITLDHTPKNDHWSSPPKLSPSISPPKLSSPYFTSKYKPKTVGNNLANEKELRKKQLIEQIENELDDDLLDDVDDF